MRTGTNENWYNKELLEAEPPELELVLKRTTTNENSPVQNRPNKSKKKCEDMRRDIENPREEEEERNMQEKSDYEKKKQEKSVPAKLGQPIDKEQQAEIQPDADGVNEGQPTAPEIDTLNGSSSGAHDSQQQKKIDTVDEPTTPSYPLDVSKPAAANQRVHDEDHVRLTRDPDDNEVRNHLLTVLTDFARDTAEEVLERNPDASSDDIIDALRAQYEDQYSTQYRLDAIKACFQYAQEPVQDFYQRVRKLMREAQTGANRAEVIRVGKQGFLEGLQPEIRFFVTTAKSSEFEQMYKDAIFFEKALLDKERKDEANATVVANRPTTAEVFAQAAQQHREFYDYDNEEGYPMVASFAPRGQGQFQQQETPRRTQYNSSYQGYRASANRSFNRDQNQRHSQFRVLECWYCMRPGHYRFECQTRKEDMSRGICRNSVDDPQNAPPGAASADNHERRPPRNPIDNHQQFTVKALHASPSDTLPCTRKTSCSLLTHFPCVFLRLSASLC
uniref:Retrotransposon gag domain-containing protein n=1 Tax=Caenorhabditis japonica TaxID=281687 RepID=A0A8R1IIL8_CAEJA